MEDVKWFIKKYGFFIVLMAIIVIIGSIILGKRGSEKNAEEVGEPPAEILSDHTSVPVGNKGEISSNNIVEEDELKDAALIAAEQVKEVYKDIELIGESSYGSNIKEFTREQCREVVTLLGRAGYASVTEDTNMENYEKVEDFYTAYMEKRDAMVTIFNVNRDGLIGAVTFIHRNNELLVPAFHEAFVSEQTWGTSLKMRSIFITFCA